MTRAALAICPEPPYPLAGGGAIRTASLLEYLARRYALDLILFRRPGDPNPAAALPAGLARKVWVLHLAAHGRSLPVRMARNASRLLRGAPPLLDRFSGFAGEIGEIARQGSWDLAVIEHFWCAPYWEQVAPRSRRTVLDLHNIESLWHQRCARAQGGAAGLALAAFARRCLQLEARWLPRFTSVLAPSEPDCAAIGGIAPGCRAFAYANALPPAVKRAEREVRNDIVFSGNLAYHPNILAVRYFRREIWPLLRARWPGLEWRLVGKNPQAVMRHVAGDERIRLSGPVENAVAELARAKVAVAPLLAGSGTRVKILEAWAAGVPVVSTSLGCEGLPVRDGREIRIADTPAAFAGAVSELLGSQTLAGSLATAAKALLEQEFTWEAVWKKLEQSKILV